jgi:hypothetical protein
MKPLIALLLLLATRGPGADAELPIDPSDDFSPMLAMFALVAAVIALFLIGAGIFCAALVAASIAALASLGIVSSAVAIGMARRRLSSGLRTCHYLVCAALALPSGIGILWLGSSLTRSALGTGEILTIGAISGIGGGLGLAFVLDRLASILYRRFAAAGSLDRTAGH